MVMITNFDLILVQLHFILIIANIYLFVVEVVYK
nr:MAG TPA: hypothetical protein [Caudoviricetes sp.]